MTANVLPLLSKTPGQKSEEYGLLSVGCGTLDVINAACFQPHGRPDLDKQNNGKGCYGESSPLAALQRFFGANSPPVCANPRLPGTQPPVVKYSISPSIRNIGLSIKSGNTVPSSNQRNGNSGRINLPRALPMPRCAAGNMATPVSTLFFQTAMINRPATSR